MSEVYEDPHERARLRQLAIEACTLCDEDGYRFGTVCDHVDRTEINRRGMALVRKALEGKPNNPAVLHRHLPAEQRVAAQREAAPPADMEPELPGNRALDTDPEPEL